jgi:hypothetical protein
MYVCMCFVWISEQKAVISLYNINSWFLFRRSIVFSLRYKLNLFVQLRMNLDTVFTSVLQCFKLSDFIFINWSLRNKDSLSLSIPHFNLLPSFLPSFTFLYFAFMKPGTTIIYCKKMTTHLTPIIALLALVGKRIFSATY